MKLRVDETLVGTDVAAVLYLGTWGAEPTLIGAVQTDLDSWLTLLHRLSAGHYDVERGPCPDCRCRGHVGDVCFEGVYRRGELDTCGCAYGAAVPVPFTVVLTPAQELAAQVTRERAYEDWDDDAREARDDADWRGVEARNRAEAL